MTGKQHPAAGPGRPWPTGDLLQATAVAALAFASNASALGNGFVFDDLLNVLGNPWVLQPERVWEAFSHNLAAFKPGLDTTYYRPVMHLVFASCYALAGPAPWIFHLINVLTHTVTSVGVYLITSSWCEGGADSNRPGDLGVARRTSTSAFLGAALFAVHPIHAEAVAWVAGIVDLSYSLFCVFAFLAAMDRRRTPVLRTAIAPALFLLALLSKEPALMLLPVISVAKIVRGDLEDKVGRRRAASVLAVLAVAVAVYLPLRVAALGGVMRGPSRVQVSALEGVATAFGLLGEYARMMVLPVNLSAMQDFHVVRSLLSPQALLGALVVVVLLAVTWMGRRRRAVVVGSAFLLFPLLPALYAPVLGEGLAAERYTYLPTVGLALLVTALLDLAKEWSRKVAVSAAMAGVLVVLVSAVVTFRRDAVWRDNLTLWSDAVEKVPESGAAHEYLGHALLTAGRPEAAVAELLQALRLDPSRKDAHVNLALALMAVGKPEAALEQAWVAVRVRPQRAEAHSALGYALAALGRHPEAVNAYEKAISIDPLPAPTWNLLGIAYANVGRPDLAIPRFQQAIRLAPGNTDYRRNLAILMESGAVPR